jgi:hypothetical protein
MKHPIQKTKIDAAGILRFVNNDVVCLMLDMLKHCGHDLNTIHSRGRNIPQEDWDQFNQLIGYSVSGAPIDERIIDAAQRAHETGTTADQAMRDNNAELLESLRKNLRVPIAELYGKHPDDLCEPPNPSDQRAGASPAPPASRS